MKKVSWFLFFVLTAALVSGAKGGSGTPATATFRDATTDRIVDDGNGSYQNGVNCVNSFVQGGLYFLRTVEQSCRPTTQRAIVLNFSNIVSPPSSCTPISVSDSDSDADDTGTPTLNPCGTNSIPDVRLSASTLFKGTSPGTTSVTLHLNLQANFGEQEFELDFLNPVPFSGSSTTRVLTAGPDAANSQLAELYRITESGRKVSVGIYNMPFQVTVTEQ